MLFQNFWMNFWWIITSIKMTIPPPCFTDELVLFGPWADPLFCHTLILVLSAHKTELQTFCFLILPADKHFASCHMACISLLLKSCSNGGLCYLLRFWVLISVISCCLTDPLCMCFSVHQWFLCCLWQDIANCCIGYAQNLCNVSLFSWIQNGFLFFHRECYGFHVDFNKKYILHW